MFYQQHFGTNAYNIRGNVFVPTLECLQNCQTVLSPVYTVPIVGPDGPRWMAKSAGFVSTSANSEGTSVNNVTLPGNILIYRQWRPNEGQHRQTTRKKRTCLLILGVSGVNRFIGVYRVISGRERKRTQVLQDFPGVHRLYSLMFRGLSCFIVFIGSLTHTKYPRQTHDVSGVGRVYSVCVCGGGGGGSGVFLNASALFRYVRVYIGSNSAGNRGWVSIPPMVYHLSAHNPAWIETTSGLITNTW